MQISKFAKEVYLCSLTVRQRLLLLDKIENSGNSDDLEDKITHWKFQAGETSEGFFQKRLKWSDINPISVSKLLLPIERFNFDDSVFPDWVHTLDEFANKDEESVPSSIKNNISFSDVLSPLVEYFSHKLGTIPKEIAETALSDLKLSLLDSLSEISSQCFLEAYYFSDLNYKEFTDQITSDNFKSFFLNYPYLARLIFTRGTFWVNNTKYLFNVLHEDRVKICKYLQEDSFKIIGFASELSESHNNGKNVVVLKTESSKFVFKHRSMTAEKKFFDLLENINDNFHIKQYTPWIIEGDGYGWMEFISLEECSTKEDVGRYYERCGALLCLFYVFGATDLHSENLISHGEFPVFIDLETLLNPLSKLNYKHLNKLNSFIDYKYGLSVSRAGILPQWLLGPDTKVYNNSSLGGSKEGLLYPDIVWKNIGTDKVSYSYVEVEPPKDKNLVYLRSDLQEPSEYLTNFLEGFSEMYSYLVKNRAEPKFTDMLDAFSDLDVRFVFRATRVYSLLLKYLNHPDYMKSGVDRSLELEILAKGFLVDLSKKHVFWDVLEDELQQLEDNDIPYYKTNSSKLTLSSINGDIYKDAFQYKGFKNFKKLLNSMDEEDLKFQEKIIKNSIETESIRNTNSKYEKYENTHQNLPSTSQIDSVIEDIARRIIETRIEMDGRMTWASYVSNVVSHTYGYKPIGLDIANGNMGIAIFFAALYKDTGDSSYLAVIKKTVKPIMDILSKDWAKKEFILRFGTGGTTGVGSIIYGFSKLFEYTDDRSYLNNATMFFNSLSNKNIKSSLRQDVVSGNAGLMLSLIKLFEFKKDSSVRSMLNDCYKELIESGYEKGNFTAWSYQMNKKLVGFSHGSSGILYAIARYCQLFREEKCIEVLSDILKFETKQFNKDYCNWPDSRFSEVSFDAVSWCHGAIGIGMSRLDLIGDLDLGILTRQDIKNSIKKMLDTGGHFLDTVCCGNGGRIDFILEVQRKGYKDDSLNNYLFWLINNLLKRYDADGDFRYFSKFKTDDTNVGFYQGISGIGYQLLRYKKREDYKSVLLFK